VTRPPRIYLSPPHIGDTELTLVQEAFTSNWVAPLGPFVDRLEGLLASRIGVKHSVALSSGTAAIHLALRAAGVGPGDSVVVLDPDVCRIGGPDPLPRGRARLH